MSFEKRRLVQIGNYRLERKNLGKGLLSCNCQILADCIIDWFFSIIGTFGNVELAIHRHFKTKVALKIIDKKVIKDAYSVANLDREPFLMMDLNHPNVSRILSFQSFTVLSTYKPPSISKKYAQICRLIEVCKSTEIYVIVLEYIPGLSLLDNLHQSPTGKLSGNQTREIGCQLIGAISYLHSNKIIHRDLKLENVSMIVFVFLK